MIICYHPLLVPPVNRAEMTGAQTANSRICLQTSDDVGVQHSDVSARRHTWNMSTNYGGICETQDEPVHHFICQLGWSRHFFTSNRLFRAKLWQYVSGFMLTILFSQVCLVLDVDTRCYWIIPCSVSLSLMWDNNNHRKTKLHYCHLIDKGYSDYYQSASTSSAQQHAMIESIKREWKMFEGMRPLSLI